MTADPAQVYRRIGAFSITILRAKSPAKAKFIASVGSSKKALWQWRTLAGASSPCPWSVDHSSP